MGGHGGGVPVPDQLNLDQLMRRSMDMKSSLGNFRMLFTGGVDSQKHPTTSLTMRLSF
jgi:hypothetical protein